MGYGLEDVINDAKAGRIIDDNIKRINESKQLKEFDNNELSQLVTYIFSDIAHIIAEKYGINIVLNIAAPEQSSTVSTMAKNYIDDTKERLTVNYTLITKEVSEIYKYLFVIMIILLYFRALKYRYVYITFLSLSIIGYISYAVLNGTWVTILLSLLFLPLIITAFSNATYYRDDMDEVRVYKMPHLMLFLRSLFHSPEGEQFENIVYRYCLNTFITFLWNRFIFTSYAPEIRFRKYICIICYFSVFHSIYNSFSAR